MSIVDNFSRIMSEEAGKVLRIAGKGPGDVERAFERLGQAGGAVGGGVFGGGLGGVLGAGLGGCNWAT